MKEMSTIEDCVLSTVADDYESWQLILCSVRQFAKNNGVVVRRSQVLQALETLINNGHVQCYVLRAVAEGWATPASWDHRRLHELWYYITRSGLSRIKELKADS
jgi:hypothetical protein